MNRHRPLLLIDSHQEDYTSAAANVIFCSDVFGEPLWHPDIQTEQRNPFCLVNEIKRKPARLISHIHRIYQCYREQLDEPLFAALVDLLIVLNHRGKAVSRRMVLGSKKSLKAEQLAALSTVLTDPDANVSLLAGNRYSIFSKGLEGTVTLVQKTTDTLDSHYDPLQLAADAVEYCQLNEAMAILENAIREQPDQLSWLEALLELYRSAGERSRFDDMAVELAGKGVTLPESWRELKEYFEGHPNQNVR